MNRSLLYQSSRTQLIQQLIYFDEERNGFLNSYCNGSTRLKNSAEELINRYCAALEELLSDFSEDKLNSRVLIGSRLNLRYLEDGYTDTHTIVFPAYTEPSAGKISLLSPMGMQLLLAECNTEYLLEVPSGKIAVMIDSITYENGGEVEKAI
ncbi:GreA/GreB family elongation factor [Paenibacillus sp. PK3_47]|uniref:GreA/GreB family elongation factor n=1 Tax=Paenibacillus sp. PK3_47 TaxID=2072642 RepID=UPI00201DCC47|nr:GreA/GreB family elongation factor [Paenibacillus sp. PK3_47]